MIIQTSHIECPMNPCSNLFYLSAIVCKLSECLTKEELSVLSADLLVLSDMIGNVLARQDACDPQSQ